MTDSQPKPGIAIITGAASGMGEAAARLMDEAGWSLLMCDVNAERLDAAAAQLPSGRTPTTLAGDMADPSWPQDLVEALAGRAVGAVIHCAGLSPTMAGPERILEVNLAATMRMVDALRPLMAAGSAAVLFASSAAHMMPGDFDQQIGEALATGDMQVLVPLCPESGTAYSISKRAVQLLCQREAPAFGKIGARIATISPGIIATPMGEAEMKKFAVMQQMVEVSPLGRAARAEEVSAVAVFLCSPAASFVTGVDILVDGGSVSMMKAARG